MGRVYLVLLTDKRRLGGPIRALGKVEGSKTEPYHRARTFPTKAKARAYLRRVGAKDPRFRYSIELA